MDMQVAHGSADPVIICIGVALLVAGLIVLYIIVTNK